MRLHPIRILRFIIYCIPFLTFLSVVIYVISSQPNRNATNRSANISEALPELVSYEDLKLISREAKRVGPGEHGIPVRLSNEDKKIAKNYENQNGFNIFVSDKIAIDRSVADIRHPKCKTKVYLSSLPTTSVIIPFFEEHWSTLLRTFTSVLLRTPAHLLKEIILVDDGSHLIPGRDFLKSQLDNYLKTNYPDGKVRVIRSPSREGLITARLRGAKAASGDILVFLDSHCEPNHNWLPPLVDLIARDYRTVTCPFIDVIQGDTFQYRAQDEGARGAFDWEFYYKRLSKLPKDLPHPDEPFDSPVMAGGLFAINAKWFWELGGYDPGLVIWGGEQYELSFKIWMCGGRMVDIPCSRIGHIYRIHPTNFPNAGLGDFLTKNYKRVAEVWMDEYKEYLYNRRPSYRAVDPGNLTEQIALRSSLKCKSFKWFMTEVAFDLTKKYPLIDPIPEAVGDIRPVVNSSLCIDALDASETVPVKLSKCIRGSDDTNGMQQFELSYHKDIRVMNRNQCFDLPSVYPRAPVMLFDCHGGLGNQHWQLVPLNESVPNMVSVKHVLSNHCLESDLDAIELAVNPCQPDRKEQYWIWDKLQIEAAAESRKKAGL